MLIIRANDSDLHPIVECCTKLRFFFVLIDCYDINAVVLSSLENHDSALRVGIPMQGCRDGSELLPVIEKSGDLRNLFQYLVYSLLLHLHICARCMMSTTII